MKWVSVLALAALLSGCATAPGSQEPGSLLHDALFAAPSAPVAPDEVFAVSPAMQDFLAREIEPEARRRGTLTALVAALNERAKLKLEYDATMTRNAAQTFATRSGNCMSLVLMTAALARELGIDVRYQVVLSDETWRRVGETYVSIGHVNLSLAATRLQRGDERMTVDFLPAEQVRHARTLAVAEPTIVAMYMNNRAVESFTSGRVDDAYWFAREAIRQDPRYLAARNTLGVVYRLHGHPAEAERAFRDVLAQEPANRHALANLVPLLRESGRAAESERLALRLRELESYPPFHFHAHGMAAMRRGDYATAATMFEREIERDAYYHEFHFWLAAALQKLGRAGEARRHLEIAIETSPTRGDRDLYASKLALIGAGRVH